jgi:hypothetical protein
MEPAMNGRHAIKMAPLAGGAKSDAGSLGACTAASAYVTI